jgi:hypothetical protein
MSPVASYSEHTYTNGTGISKPLVDGFGTRAIHVGSEPVQETGAVIRSISLSTTYKQDGIGNHRVCSSCFNPNSVKLINIRGTNTRALVIQIVMIWSLCWPRWSLEGPKRSPSLLDWRQHLPSSIRLDRTHIF